MLFWQVSVSNQTATVLEATVSSLCHVNQDVLLHSLYGSVLCRVESVCITWYKDLCRA